MNVDDLFKGARRLKAPHSLKMKVREEIAQSSTLESKPSWVEGVSNFLFPLRKGLAVAGALAMIILVVHFSQPTKEAYFTQKPEVSIAELENFVNETLGQEFLQDEEQWPWFEEEGEPDDFDQFFEDQLNEIFSLNGGNNHA